MKDLTDYFSSPTKPLTTKKEEQNENKYVRVKFAGKVRDAAQLTTASPIKTPKMEPQPSPKVNAFDFMMNSQRSSIGHNSGGKIDTSDPKKSPPENKKKLEARKTLFENWADLKGASKRKREEEEVERTIKLKMEERAKRLKKIITQGGKTSDKSPSPIKKLKESNLLNFVNKRKDVEVEDDDLSEERKIKIKLFNNTGAKPKKSKKKKQLDDSMEDFCTPEPEKRSLRKRNNVNYAEMVSLELPKPTNSNKKKPKTKPETIDLSSDDQEIKTVAPIFLKATPKPKLDPEVVEARKKFLLSGIPDSLKKTVEKQRSFEEKVFEVFPEISHVQQRCSSHLWTLKKPQLNLTTPQAFEVGHLQFSNFIVKDVQEQQPCFTNKAKLKKLKAHLFMLKQENPNYPVFKVFRHLFEKSGKSSKTKRKSVDETSKDHEMWTDKYKATSSEQIMDNTTSVNKLRNFLETWIKQSEQINARRQRRDSESEFESTDCDSRDSMRLPGNTIILYGPPGSGKTSAVYAIASEFELNVLELNASTKRTGKRLMQELQEATQSHQVRKNEPNKRMCILLIEDIDLIFDQDEGFLSSLTQLIQTSKRPIVMTTTEQGTPHVQKFAYQHETVPFRPLTTNLVVYLQILCLIEGILVDKGHLACLLGYNRGDIRKSLLQLQFWVQSGGQIRSKELPYKIVGVKSGVKVKDEEMKVLHNEEKIDERIHKNCLEVLNGDFIPINMDLGLVVWNIPNLMNISLNSHKRLRGGVPPAPNALVDGGRLKLFSQFYDSLVLTDVMFQQVNCHDLYYWGEPVIHSYQNAPIDSLELTPRQYNEKSTFTDLTQELSHFLLNSHLQQLQPVIGNSHMDMTLPNKEEKRWRAEQLICEDNFMEPVPVGLRLDRSALALDYLPAMRDVARLEEERSQSNTKRGNRFRHYFKELEMSVRRSCCQFACGIFDDG